MVTDYFLDLALQLKPLYADLINSVKEFHNMELVPFCMQWGEEYPTEYNKGIMFYGRATNGWVTTDLDVDSLFNLANDDRIFARDDQMTWVDDCANEIGNYNTNRSAFWRVVRQVASHFYPNGAMQHICWSNVSKIAPDGANPSDLMFYAQLPSACKIMQKEIEIFSPRHVVLLVGEGWAADYLYYLNGNQHTTSIATYTWGTTKKFKIKVYKIGDTFFYQSEHPERKNESTHVEALIRAILKNDME